MMEPSIKRLQYLCDTIPPLLARIDETVFSLKPAPDKWSKKEIIGHLTDSATNNHHRFIRAQFEEAPEITYNQDKWCSFGYYQKMDSKQIISFWTIYNRHLLELTKLIPPENLSRVCNRGGEQATIAFLITDYVAHLEHHLHQVVDY